MPTGKHRRVGWGAKLVVMQNASHTRRGLFHDGFQQLMNQAAEMTDLKRPLAFLGHDRSYTKLRRRVMATDFQVIYPSYEGVDARRAGMAILDEAQRFDRMLNIWKGESELKRLNQTASERPVKVSPELFRMLRLAKKIWRETDGAFDLTATPLTRCWGFFYRKGRVPDESEIQEALSRVGMQHVILDPGESTVFFDKPGIEITPASIGKGLALDHAIRLAKNSELKDVLLNGGFSSVLAQGAPEWKEDWQIDIRNPLDHTQAAARLRLRDQGFSSSGSEEQYFEHEGRIFSHIIDPRTGWPAESVVSVNVVAKTAAYAEALSTAFFVMGVEKTIEYCENHPQVGVVMISLPHSREQLDMITVNLESNQLEVVNASC